MLGTALWGRGQDRASPLPKKLTFHSGERSECVGDNIEPGKPVASDMKERDTSWRMRPTGDRVWGGNTEAKAEKGARDNHQGAVVGKNIPEHGPTSTEGLNGSSGWRVGCGPRGPQKNTMWSH